MKVKLIASEEHYDALARELLAHGIELDDEAGLILQEADAFLDRLTCRRENERFLVRTEEILYIESLAHDILVHTAEAVYKTGERLWQLDRRLDPQKFLRISHSVIVAKDAIQSIRPALSQKFLLTLSDGSHVDVTRTYYLSFREALGI